MPFHELLLQRGAPDGRQPRCRGQLRADRQHRCWQTRGAKQQADPASAAKPRFLTNMSHEMATPKNRPLAMAAVLLGKPGSAQQHGRALLAAPSRQFSDRLDEEAATVLTDAWPSNQRTLKTPSYSDDQ